MAQKKKISPMKVQAKAKTALRSKPKPAARTKADPKPAGKKTAVVKPVQQTTDKVRVVNKISPPRIHANGDERKQSRLRAHQYAFMKAPGMMHDFQVGDKVEVFCDHEKGRERVRGWIAGIVVQVDNKMVAVQFRSNVYLTDGWMVPDRILWYPLTSEHIRPLGSKKPAKREEKVITDY